MRDAEGIERGGIAGGEPFGPDQQHGGRDAVLERGGNLMADQQARQEGGGLLLLKLVEQGAGAQAEQMAQQAAALPRAGQAAREAARMVRQRGIHGAREDGVD